MNPEDAKLFDDVDWGEPEVPKTEVKATPKALEPPSVPKTEPLIMPECADCAAALNPENSTRLRNGKWKHVGCPKTASEVKKPAPETVTVSATSVVSIPPAASATPAPVQGATTVTHTVIYELGPQTLAALKALLGK